MKRGAFILVPIIIIILASCSSKEVIRHNYRYIGENELWSAEYKIVGVGTLTEKDGKLGYESNSNDELTVTYKKDLSELSSVNHLKITFESSSGSGKLTHDFNGNPPTEKIYKIKSSSSGGAIVNEDEIIKVIIDLDGEKQMIELKNVP